VKTKLILIVLLVALGVTSAAATGRHQGKGKDSFITAGVNSVRDWKIEVGNSTLLQGWYKKVFGDTFPRIKTGAWEYWCLSKDYEMTVYCIKQKDGRVYSTCQIVSAGTPVLGYRDCDGIRRILILADCGNPITNTLPLPYCLPKCPPKVEPKPEPECQPETGCALAPIQPAVVACEEPLLAYPMGTPTGTMESARQVRLGENGFLGSVVTGSVIIPTKVPNTNVSQSVAQSTGDTNVATGPTNVATGPTTVNTGPTTVNTPPQTINVNNGNNIAISNPIANNVQVNNP
jgi:hypothetical protein